MYVHIYEVLGWVGSQNLVDEIHRIMWMVITELCGLESQNHVDGNHSWLGISYFRHFSFYWLQFVCLIKFIQFKPQFCDELTLRLLMLYTKCMLPGIATQAITHECGHGHLVIIQFTNATAKLYRCFCVLTWQTKKLINIKWIITQEILVSLQNLLVNEAQYFQLHLDFYTTRMVFKFSPWRAFRMNLPVSIHIKFLNRTIENEQNFPPLKFPQSHDRDRNSTTTTWTGEESVVTDVVCQTTTYAEHNPKKYNLGGRSRFAREPESKKVFDVVALPSLFLANERGDERFENFASSSSRHFCSLTMLV